MNKIFMLVTFLQLFGVETYAQNNNVIKSGERIAYKEDFLYRDPKNDAKGVVLSVDYQKKTVCIKFDEPRRDGQYERCGIDISSVYRSNSESPTANLAVGQRVKYDDFEYFNDDSDQGILVSIDTYYNRVCILFFNPRYDGKYERCNVRAKFVSAFPVNENLLTGFSLQQRVLYTFQSKTSKGIITSIDQNNNLVCILFDKEEKCKLSPYLIRSEDLEIGKKVLYLPNKSEGVLLSIDQDNNTSCVEFDNGNVTCGIVSALLSLKH